MYINFQQIIITLFYTIITLLSLRVKDLALLIQNQLKYCEIIVDT